MTRLEQYLFKQSEGVAESNTTYSRYFTIGRLKIRLSDHFSIDSDSDFQIIIPINGGSKYTVFFKGNTKLVIWTAKQIKEFMPAYILQAEMMHKSARNISNEYKWIKSTLNSEGLTTTQRSIFEREKKEWTYAEATALCGMFIQEFGKATGVNGAFQHFLRHHKLDYEDVLNLYDYLIVNKKKVATEDLLVEAFNRISKCRK